MPGQNSVIVAISTFKFKFVNLYVLKYIHIYYENVTDSLKTVESGADRFGAGSCSGPGLTCPHWTLPGYFFVKNNQLHYALVSQTSLKRKTLPTGI